jgi:hypothetical protein
VTFKVGDRVVLNAAAAAIAKALGGLRGTVVEVGHNYGDETGYTVEFDEPLPKVLGLGSKNRMPVVSTYLDHEPVEVPKPTIHAPPPCSFCGEPCSAFAAASEYTSGLRCQAEPWHVCHKPTCNASIHLHTQRLEAGLFDTSETRAATRAWYVAKVEREKKEAREARLARMVP